MVAGKHTYGTQHITEYSWGNDGKLFIGAFCSIANNIKVYLGGNHRSDWLTTYPFGHIHKELFNTFNGEGHPATNGDVIIGNDVWIGGNVTIMSGVKVGDGAIIANNSHVVKDVPPYSIFGGNPARLIKKRFDDETINKLLEIKWWEWDDNKINNNLRILCSNNINDLINNENNNA